MFFKTSKFFLYASVFAVAIVTTSTLFPFIVGKYVWFRIAVDLALISFLLGLLFDPRKGEYGARLKKMFCSPLVIAVTVFAVIFVLSGFFGVDPAFSFWSSFERGEGGFQMIHLWLFFILLTTLFREKKDWKLLFWCSVVAAVLMALYGVGAELKYIDADYRSWTDDFGRLHHELSGEGGPWFRTFYGFIAPAFSSPGFRFQGSIGNPAYVAAFLVFVLAYLAFLARDAWMKKRKWVLGLLSFLCVFFLAFFALAATRGAFLGLMAGAFVFLVLFGYSKPSVRRWVWIFCGAVALFLLLLFVFRDAPAVTSLPFSRFLDLSVFADTFQDRLIVWKMAWEGWKERPLFGWGIENFIHVYDRHFDPALFTPPDGFPAWFDRAHNVVFDYLTGTGVLGLLSYLGIFAVFFVEVIRRLLKPSGDSFPAVEKALVAGAVAAYLVQGLVLFDVLVIYMNLLLVLAYVVFRIGEVEASSGSAVKP